MGQIWRQVQYLYKGKSSYKSSPVFFALINSSMRGLLPQDLIGASEKIKNLHFGRFASPLFSFKWKENATVFKFS